MPVTTPTIKITIDGAPVFIKREDLYVAPVTATGAMARAGAPPFAKPRGLVPYLKKLKWEGVKNVAYMDTAISMAGWAISYYAPPLGLNPIILWPGYKDGNRHNMERHIGKCVQLGAEVFYLENPTQLSINWYRARKFISSRFERAVLLPQGLPFRQTILDVAQEVISVPRAAWGGTVVISVGSGTMAAGLITGLMAQEVNQRVVGVLASPKNCAKMEAVIREKASGFLKGAWCKRNLRVVDTGLKYTAVPSSDIAPTFPCCPYYDLKAWAWLRSNLKTLEQPVLFWNIGA